MNLSPFPALDPKDAVVRATAAEPYEFTAFPTAGFLSPRRDEPQFHYPGSPAVWSKPRLEAVQALRPRVPIGLRPLDDFLGGGLPGGSILTVIGPPFGGKRTLACQFLASSIAAGAPGLAAITDGDVNQWRNAVATLAARVPDERKGLACFLELGADEGRPSDLMPLTDRILSAVGNACESLPTDRRRFVLDSFTTVVALCGYNAAMAMLIRLTALLRREGATSLILLEAGAHTPLELQLVKRQADGALEFRQYGGMPEIQVTGLGLPAPSPWLPGRTEGGPIAVPQRPSTSPTPTVELREAAA